MTRNLSLVLTTSVLALTLVQPSAYAGAHHHPEHGGAAPPARTEHAAPRSAASHREPVAMPRPNYRPAAGPSTSAEHGWRHPIPRASDADLHLRKDEIGRATSKAIDRPAPHAAFTSRIETPLQAGPGTQYAVEPRGDVPASLPRGDARDLRAPADLRGVVGPAGGAAPRMSNPAAERSLDREARTLLKPNRNGTIEQSAVDRYVALNNAAGNAVTVTPAIGQEKFTSLLGKLNGGIRTGDYRVVPLTAGHGPAGPAGNSRTIVVGRDDNGKTVYVPASQLSGPDKRTIDVNCNDCKVVVVGDTAKAGRVQDDRRIVVNGRGDDVVDQGDRANGGAGRNGGAVTDGRQITVNGRRDDVTSGGDSANGGNGRTGRNGGSGGAIDDNRGVVVNASRDKVTFGTNSADGGNGGRGGGNGGDGGAITDHRRVDDNGSSNRVKAGGDRANGGNGGNGF
jgi:hypothetical protein